MAHYNFSDTSNIFTMNKSQGLNKTEIAQQSSHLSQEECLQECLSDNSKKFCKWTAIENESYAEALNVLVGEFQEEYLRRTKKVFVLISERVKTKTPDQCRSHHQKMMKHSKSIKNIIKRFLRGHRNKKANRKQQEQGVELPQSLVVENSKPSTEKETIQERTFSQGTEDLMRRDQNLDRKQENWQLWLSL